MTLVNSFGSSFFVVEMVVLGVSFQDILNFI